MMRKRKRLMGLCLSIVLFATLFLPMNVNASLSREGIKEGSIMSSANSLCSVEGKKIPSALIESLKVYDVNINPDTLLEVVPLTEGSGESVLAVTNIINNKVVKDFVFAFDEEGNILSPQISNSSNAVQRDGSSVEYPYNEGFVIRATAVYNQKSYMNTLHSYYQPIAVYFVFYNSDGSYVTYIEVEYLCIGYEYTYPGYVEISGNEYRHSIVVTKDIPSTNTMYQAYNEYNKNRVIWTGSGSQNVGQYLIFTYRLDGRLYSRTIEF